MAKTPPPCWPESQSQLKCQRMALLENREKYLQLRWLQSKNSRQLFAITLMWKPPKPWFQRWKTKGLVFYQKRKLGPWILLLRPRKSLVSTLYMFWKCWSFCAVPRYCTCAPVWTLLMATRKQVVKPLFLQIRCFTITCPFCLPRGQGWQLTSSLLPGKLSSKRGPYLVGHEFCWPFPSFGINLSEWVLRKESESRFFAYTFRRN